MMARRIGVAGLAGCLSALLVAGSASAAPATLPPNPPPPPDRCAPYPACPLFVSLTLHHVHGKIIGTSAAVIDFHARESVYGHYEWVIEVWDPNARHWYRAGQPVFGTFPGKGHDKRAAATGSCYPLSYYSAALTFTLHFDGKTQHALYRYPEVLYPRKWQKLHKGLYAGSDCRAHWQAGIAP